MSKEYYVYIMTNKRDGVLYVGVTSDLPKRAWEHREGVVPGFTRKSAKPGGIADFCRSLARCTSSGSFCESDSVRT